jgi:2-phospho-L-lactate guanylyltransferase
MSGVFAIVPVKPLDQGKSRLRAILDDHQRLALNTRLMKRTFDLAASFPGPEHTIVVSRSECVRSAARRWGFVSVLETGNDLNTALATATSEAIMRGATGVFVLPVDLPLARSAMIEDIVERGCGQVCVLIPDRHGTGTNFMVLSPPRCDVYRFGLDSFRLHRIAAAEKGLRTIVLRHDALAMDVDDGADYRWWQSVAAEQTG